ncbi:hypothetical protein FTX61_00695 [Nitriliruptoraceae bacterium ZYF776]|nr:hypothetical protein [Profundirhabdus halotolerans]
MAPPSCLAARTREGAPHRAVVTVTRDDVDDPVLAGDPVEVGGRLAAASPDGLLVEVATGDDGDPRLTTLHRAPDGDVVTVRRRLADGVTLAAAALAVADLPALHGEVAGWLDAVGAPGDEAEGSTPRALATGGPRP